MGLVDVFNPEDRVEVKFSDFYSLLKTAAKAETITEIAMVEENPAKAGSIIKKLALAKKEKEES